MFKTIGLVFAIALVSGCPYLADAASIPVSQSPSAPAVGTFQHITADLISRAEETIAVISVAVGDLVATIEGRGQNAPVSFAAAAAAPADELAAPSPPPSSQPQSGPKYGGNSSPPAAPQFPVAKQTIVEPPVQATETASQLSSLIQIVSSLLSIPPSFAPRPAQTAIVSQAIAADGNPDAIGAGAAIDQLSNTSISNPTITGGSITASSIAGTIGNAISSALATIDDLTSNTITATNVTFTDSTTTNASIDSLNATNATTTNFYASGTSSLTALVLPDDNCSTYGNGGKLTTDAFGNVVCAADQGGSGSTVAGSNAEVQFNDGGSFGANSALTFDKTSSLLTVANASTTNLSVANGATLGNATSTSLFSPIADFTNGIISALNTSVANIVGFTATNATTSSLYVTGVRGALLKTDANGQVAAAVAGTDYQAPITAGNLTAGSNLSVSGGSGAVIGSGASISLGSSVVTGVTNDTNFTGSISGNDLTLGWTGTLAPGRGGTGIGSPTAAGVLLGAYAGAGYQQLATSSLGLLTTNVAEGSNLYFTNARAQAAIAISGAPLTYSGGIIGINQASGSQPGYLSSGDWSTFNGKVSSTSLSAGAGIGYNSSTGVISNTGVTSDVAGTGISLSGGTAAVTITNSGVTNLAASYPLLTSGAAGALTLSLGFGTTTANTWSNLQTFNTGASSTNISASGEGYFAIASATNLILGTGTGFLQANSSGIVSATSTFSAGSIFGVLPVGNGGTGASTLTGLIATADLASANISQFTNNSGYLTSLSGAASSTLLANNNTFSGNDLFSQPLTLTSTTGTTSLALGQGFTIGGNQFIFQQGSGHVGIGTTTPSDMLDVGGAIGLTAVTSSSDLPSNGIYLSAANTLDFAANGTEGLELNNSGANINAGSGGQVTGYSAIASGGTGWTTGDIGCVVGGNYQGIACFTVTASGGAVTNLSLLYGGSYSTFPSNPVSLSDWNSAASTNASVNVTTSAPGTQNLWGLDITGAPLNGGAQLRIDANGIGTLEVGSHDSDVPYATVGFIEGTARDSANAITNYGAIAFQQYSVTHDAAQGKISFYARNASDSGGLPTYQEMSLGRGLIVGCPTTDKFYPGCSDLDGPGIGTLTTYGNIYTHSNTTQYEIADTSGNLFGTSLTLTGNLTVPGQASTTLFSAYGPAFFGGTATTTIDSAGNIIGAGTLKLNGATGTSTIASGQGFTIGGNQFIVQQGSGDVGIGTNAPAGALSVGGVLSANTSALSITSAASATGALNLNNFAQTDTLNATSGGQIFLRVAPSFLPLQNFGSNISSIQNNTIIGNSSATTSSRLLKKASVSGSVVIPSVLEMERRNARDG